MKTAINQILNVDHIYFHRNSILLYTMAFYYFIIKIINFNFKFYFFNDKKMLFE
jgi:hypothetical protein